MSNQNKCRPVAELDPASLTPDLRSTAGGDGHEDLKLHLGNEVKPIILDEYDVQVGTIMVL